MYEFIFVDKFLSSTNLIGELDSNPFNLQVNFELSEFNVLEDISMPWLKYLNKCETSLLYLFVIYLFFEVIKLSLEQAILATT